jgi:RNA 2',3'-cyclic 3'-phosphodiesterase
LRLFTAIEIGEEVRRELSGTVDELKRRMEQSAPHARVAWVKPEQLHLTVRFIGQTDPERCQRILVALERPLHGPPFELTIAGTGTFPPKRPPRVIWAGISGSLDRLHALEQEVRARLDAILPAGDDREYRPHLTLGRVKNPAGLRPAVLLTGLEQVHFGDVRVGAVTLFESRLSSTGPTYTALGLAPLARTS